MPDDQAEARAALESEMDRIIGEGRDPIGKARYDFEIGWQARGAYDRGQCEHLRETLKQVERFLRQIPLGWMRDHDAAAAEDAHRIELAISWCHNALAASTSEEGRG